MALVTDGVAGPALEQLVHLQRNQFVTPALPNVQFIFSAWGPTGDGYASSAHALILLR